MWRCWVSSCTRCEISSKSITLVFDVEYQKIKNAMDPDRRPCFEGFTTLSVLIGNPAAACQLRWISKFQLRTVPARATWLLLSRSLSDPRRLSGQREYKIGASCTPCTVNGGVLFSFNDHLYGEISITLYVNTKLMSSRSMFSGGRARALMRIVYNHDDFFFLRFFSFSSDDGDTAYSVRIRSSYPVGDHGDYPSFDQPCSNGGWRSDTSTNWLILHRQHVQPCFATQCATRQCVRTLIIGF